MLSGIPLIIAFVIAIVVMILAISKFKIHPFLSIMSVSLILALVSLPDITTIPTVIGAGFSSAFSSIGIVIIFGALIGLVLEKTGAALKMSDSVVKLVGQKNPELAILLMGWVISIPVFCDSGFVVLNPIRKAMVKRTGTSSVAMTVSLAMGLYIAHCFIPPTPGPMAAAGALGVEDQMLLVMGFGALVSIPALIGSFLFAKYIGTKVKDRSETSAAASDEVVQTYEELVAAYGQLPSAAMSFAPILVPIVLMGVASALSMAKISVPILAFLGTPVMSLAVGVAISVVVLVTANKMDEFYAITDETLKTVGPILFVTAAGSVLGRVISEGSMIPYITENFNFLGALGIFFPFLLAAILKTAQGSSTVAITTTAGIVYPMLGQLGLNTPALAALTVIAIGAGAMTVSHANDSYFWVVTNFGDMDVSDGYKTQTLGTLVLGLSSMVGVLILSLFV